MWDKTIGWRLKYLMDHGEQFKPGEKVTVSGMAEALHLSERYLRYMLADHEKGQNPSLDVLESIAGYFGVNPSFFAKEPQNYVPPVNPADIQVLLRTYGALDDAGKRTLDALIERAKQLAAEQTPK